MTEMNYSELLKSEIKRLKIKAARYDQMRHWMKHQTCGGMVYTHRCRDDFYTTIWDIFTTTQVFAKHWDKDYE
jgi:hypothetical protein